MQSDLIKKFDDSYNSSDYHDHSTETEQVKYKIKKFKKKNDFEGWLDLVIYTFMMENRPFGYTVKQVRQEINNDTEYKEYLRKDFEDICKATE